MIPRKNYSFIDVILAMGLTALGFWVFSLFQSPLSHELNPLFDANQYQKAYQYFRGEIPNYTVNFPFSVRLFVPWLAAQLPWETMEDNFKVINLCFGLSWIPLWILGGQKMRLDRYKIWIGWFWITFHWVGVLKANLSDPITVDVPIYTFQLLLLWIIFEKRWWLLLLLSPLATLQKESMLPILLVLTFYPGLRWLVEGKKTAFLSLLGAFLLSWASLKMATLYFPQANEGKNALINILNYTAGLFGHPDLFLRWIFSITLAYGGFLWAGIWNRKKLRPIHLSRETLIPLVGIYAFFSLFAGGDFTRIAFLGSPFVMLFLLDALPLNFKQWTLLLLVSLPAMRLTGFLPDGGAQFDQWKTWYPEFAPWNWLGIYLAYTLLLAWISWQWFRVKSNNE